MLSSVALILFIAASVAAHVIAFSIALKDKENGWKLAIQFAAFGITSMVIAGLVFIKTYVPLMVQP